MPRNLKSILVLAVSGALIALTVYLGYIVRRAEFPQFIGAYGLFWIIYGYVLLKKNWSATEQRRLVALGIGLRVLLLFSVPNLSDDVYRFLWDGRLSAAGIHPFAHPPAWFMQNPASIPGITTELYQKLNSPEYYTVYPPVCQAVFWLAAKLFPESLIGGVFVLKLFLLGSEVGTMVLLRNLTLANPTPDPSPEGEGERRVNDAISSPLPFSGGVGLYPENSGGGVCGVGAYALNPLAILEITGNCHFEGVLLCFLLAGLRALSLGRTGWAAGFWALATASKLLPLMFVPIVLVGLGWRKGIWFGVAFAGTCALLFLPLLNIEVLSNMAGSLNLYFRQFEFNASLYYLLKQAGTALAPPKLDVARTLGPILGLTVLLGILGLAVFSPRRLGGTEALGLRTNNYMAPSPRKFVLALTLYLALATTVHPWYIVPLFGLSLLTPFRFPFVWTFAAALSYSHYAGGGFQEKYGWIALEYALVFGAMAADFFVGKRGNLKW